MPEPCILVRSAIEAAAVALQGGSVISSYRDEMGHKVEQVFDKLGRLNATREYYSTGTVNYYQTLMDYDAVGNLLIVRDAKGQVTRMAYDTLNRLNRTTYPGSLPVGLSLVESAWYDGAGRVLGKIGRDGQIMRSVYDSAGNIVRITNPSDTVSYTYDAAGQRLTAKNSLGTITHGYNSRGWVTSVQQTIGASSYSARLGYDLAGNLMWILYPDSTNVTYAYDAFNRVTYVNRTTGTALMLFRVNSYNLDGSYAQTTNAADQVTTCTYNTRDWLTKVETKAGNKVRLSLQYSYYPDGNVKYLVSNDDKTSRNESYTYDRLYQLTRAWTNASGSWGRIDFTYDEVGNRLTKVEGGVTTSYYYADLSGNPLYNQLNRTVTGATTWFYNYNKNGDLIWKNGTSVRWNYQFDAMGRLSKVVKGGVTVGEYSYDANGARARTVEGSTTVDYLFLGHDPLYDKNGTVHSKYVYANGKLVAKLIGTDAYAYLTDALGGVWQVWKRGDTSASFMVTSYKPFGVPIVSASTLKEKARFAGEMQDSSSGLYYIFVRYMDPELGRFVSLDSALGSLSMRI